jgi:hypothetical protein
MLTRGRFHKEIVLRMGFKQKKALAVKVLIRVLFTIIWQRSAVPLYSTETIGNWIEVCTKPAMLRSLLHILNFNNC